MTSAITRLAMVALLMTIAGALVTTVGLCQTKDADYIIVFKDVAELNSEQSVKDFASRLLVSHGGGEVAEAFSSIFKGAAVRYVSNEVVERIRENRYVDYVDKNTRNIRPSLPQNPYRMPDLDL